MSFSKYACCGVSSENSSPSSKHSLQPLEKLTKLLFADTVFLEIFLNNLFHHELFRLVPLQLRPILRCHQRLVSELKPIPILTLVQKNSTFLLLFPKFPKILYCSPLLEINSSYWLLLSKTKPVAETNDS